MLLSIKADFGGVQRRLDSLHKDIADRALPSAINKTLDQAKTRMGREIVRAFNVSAQFVRDRLRVKRAWRRGDFQVSGELIGGDGRRRSANLIHFVERKVSLSDARRRAKAGTLNVLRVQIRRDGGKKTIPGAFIGNKGRTVFMRTGKSRLPIVPVQTIDVPQMFNAKRINAVVVALMRAKFPDIFEREVRFYTQRFNDAR